MSAYKCGYCGGDSHYREECAEELKRTGRWNHLEWKALDRLREIEDVALRRGLQMRDIPDAVRCFATLGKTYRKDTPASKEPEPMPFLKSDEFRPVKPEDGWSNCYKCGGPTEVANNQILRCANTETCGWFTWL